MYLLYSLLVSLVGLAGLIVSDTNTRFEALQNQLQAQQQIQEQDEQRFGAFNFVSSGIYTLAGGGISSSATSIAVDNFLKPVSETQYSMTEFGDIGYLTLEPGSATNKEFVSFTSFTYSGNRATFTGVTRGLEFNSPYTASSTLRRSHSGGTKVIVSNPPQLYNQLAVKANNETITGQWTFSTFPITPSNSTSSETVAGVVEIATGAEAVASTQDGAVGRLALPATLATSTYNAATAVNRLIMSGSDGSMDLDFLGTTTIALPSSASVSHGTTTVNGSLTLAGGNSVSNIASSSIQTFTSSTTPTTSWSKPANLKYVVIKVVGGGGGGGSAASDAGGGGGAYCERIIPAAALSSSVTIAVGGGGPTEASTGGTSSFGSFCTATGGAAGTTASARGSGGTASGGNINVQGEFGHFGDADGTTEAGEGGTSAFGGLLGKGGDGNGGAGEAGAVFVWEYYY